jgi:hypothetical protein
MREQSFRQIGARGGSGGDIAKEIGGSFGAYHRARLPQRRLDPRSRVKFVMVEVTPNIGQRRFAAGERGQELGASQIHAGRKKNADKAGEAASSPVPHPISNNLSASFGSAARMNS